MANITELTGRATGMISSIGNIDSFEAVQIWDMEAQQLARALRDGIASVEKDIEEINAKADTEKSAYKSLPFFKRLMSSDPSNRTRGAIKALQQQIVQGVSAADTLDEWIDRTPDDLAEAKSMIADYKLLKKELALAKKEATQAMRDTREASRARTANLSWATGKSGKFARDMERLKKERGLAKHQSARDHVEAQILAVDKRILWLERIARA